MDLDPETARRHLGRLLAWYWEGLHRPLPLFPKASFAYARAWADGKDPAGEVRNAWVGSSFRDMVIPGDCEDPYIRLILAGADPDPMGIPDFACLAQELYGPALGVGPAPNEGSPA